MRNAKGNVPGPCELANVNRILSILRHKSGTLPHMVPPRAARLRKARSRMDVILHLGAHRTATTSFQHYMRANGAVFEADRLAFWGPVRTRNGLLHGVIPVPGRIRASQQLARAGGRIGLKVQKVKARGFQQLVISDENLIGTMRRNIRDMRIYPAAGERMARYHMAFGPRLTRVVLSIRGQESYWKSVLSYNLERIGCVPSEAELTHIATGPRSWRDVITDIACAMPGVEIVVLPHERFATRPEARLAAMTGRAGLTRRHAREMLNRSPTMPVLHAALEARGADARACGLNTGLNTERGHWNPFTDLQSGAMAEAYADDLYWLRAGADGLAILTEESQPETAGKHPAAGSPKRGQDYGKEKRLA